MMTRMERATAARALALLPPVWRRQAAVSRSPRKVSVVRVAGGGVLGAGAAALQVGIALPFLRLAAAGVVSVCLSVCRAVIVLCLENVTVMRRGWCTARRGAGCG